MPTVQKSTFEMTEGDREVVESLKQPELQFREAFLKAQKAFTAAEKGAENPFYHSKYSTLKDVWDAAKDALHSNGFTIHQVLEVEAGHNILLTRLCHIAGFTEFSRCLLPIQLDPQKAGSAITYFRRYSLAAILGIVQEDDDGNQASQPVQRPQPNNYKPSTFTPGKK